MFDLNVVVVNDEGESVNPRNVTRVELDIGTNWVKIFTIADRAGGTHTSSSYIKSNWGVHRVNYNYV